MRLRQAGAIAVVAILAGCGGDDGSETPADVFPEGGSIPEQRISDLDEAASAAGCTLKATKSRGLPDGLHTDSPDERVEYTDNPPTLGLHWPPGYQADDGLYEEPPADEALVHTMEHGRVIVWAKPALPERARASLRALFDEDSYQLVLVPRRDMPYAVLPPPGTEPRPGGTGRTLGCEEWSDKALDALRSFRDEHRSRGPERSLDPFTTLRHRVSPQRAEGGAAPRARGARAAGARRRAAQEDGRLRRRLGAGDRSSWPW